MTDYDFTFKFDISCITANPESIADVLYGNGCDGFQFKPGQKQVLVAKYDTPQYLDHGLR